MPARTDELNRFVREAMALGVSRDKIEEALLEAGWHREQAAKALAAYADVPFPLPVPRPVPHVSAGEAFAYLVLFTALGTAAFSVLELLFSLIELTFADPTDPPAITRDAWLSSMRWAVARVVIAFPVYLFTAWWIGRMLAREPAERASPVRRWLTYVAMFIAVAVIIGDLVTLVAYVLAGETTLRFLLKVAAVAAMAGGILSYYLWDLRETARESGSALSITLIAAQVAVALFAVSAGLWMLGPPSEQAALRIDDRRVEELRAIARAVDVYYERNSELPESLDALKAALEATLVTEDPETGAAYVYRPGDEKAFELCADFAKASLSVSRDTMWTHGAGRQCFPLEAGDKDRK